MSPSIGHDNAEQALARAKRSGIHKPIVDTHIHFYQPSRRGGVPWPSPSDSPTIYRDVLPREYASLARAHGIFAAGIVEASSSTEDNQWILDLIKDDSFYGFFVGQLEIGSPSFSCDLSRFVRNDRFVGIRSYLWSPTAGITLGAAQLADLRDLAQRGMTLDIISRGTTNPKPRIDALCAAVPDLRIVIDHLAGAKGDTQTSQWASWMRRLAAAHPNLYVKFSSFYDMYAGSASTWAAPTTLASYKPHFDVLMSTFGPARLIWGSNWPVSELGGSFANQIRIAEEYLSSFGTTVRDQIMFKNALLFYRRREQKRR